MHLYFNNLLRLAYPIKLKFYRSPVKFIPLQESGMNTSSFEKIHRRSDGVVGFLAAASPSGVIASSCS